jgi:hypothetical protein
MNIIVLSDYMKLLNSTRKHPTNNEYFSRHILFTTMYLLQEQKLNPKNYSEQDINMSNFIQAKEYDMIMYSNFQCMNIHVFL